MAAIGPGPSAGTSSATLCGVGLGLRPLHYGTILETLPPIPWFEALTDNYLGGGLPLHHLERVRERYPLTLHGVGLSLGSTDPLELGYVKRLKALTDRVHPVHVSDHLAWVSWGGQSFNDLAPIPYSKPVLAYVAERIQRVQDLLGRRLLIENLSPYVQFRDSTMQEWHFLAELAERADCDLLLDINNVVVNAHNHGFDPLDYLKALPADRIREIHLAGYERREDFLFDTHGHPVQADVWELYSQALERFGPIPTLIEWDTDIPSLAVLQMEAHRAEKLLKRCTPPAT